MGRHRLDYIMKRICSVDNLRLAADETKSVSYGADASAFYEYLNTNIILLQRDLMTSRYHPNIYWSFYLYYPRKRKVYSMEFSDKVVQSAIYRILKEEFQDSFYEHTYASLSNRGMNDLQSYIQTGIRECKKRYGTCIGLVCDIRHFHRNIDLGILKSRLRDYIKDISVLQLLDLFIDFHEGIDDKDPEYGLITGNKLNAFYTSIYMDPFDRYVKQDLRIKYYARYEDDMIFLLPDIDTAKEVYDKINSYLIGRLNLSLNQKTTISSYQNGISFCGNIFYQDKIYMKKSSIQNAYRFIREYEDSKINFKELTDKLISWTYHAEKYDNTENLIEKIWFKAYTAYTLKHRGMYRIDRRRIKPKCMRHIRYQHLSDTDLENCVKHTRYRMIQKGIIKDTVNFKGTDLRNYLNESSTHDNRVYFDAVWNEFQNS